MQLQFTCHFCGVVFNRNPGRHRVLQHTYCSSRCAGDARRVEEQIVCRGCGQTFSRIPSRGQVYCSILCRAEHKRRPVLDRFWEKVRKTDTCWLWTGGKREDGYGAFGVGNGVLVGAHRFSYLLTHGVLLPGSFVCHNCDTPSCVRPDHLRIDTPAGNTRDMVLKQRHQTKLSASDVRFIRSAWAKGRTQTSISTDLGVSQVLVSLILRGKAWAHVDQ